MEKKQKQKRTIGQDGKTRTIAQDGKLSRAGIDLMHLCNINPIKILVVSRADRTHDDVYDDVYDDVNDDVNDDVDDNFYGLPERWSL